MAGAVIVAIGAILHSSSYGLAQSLVGRIVAGFGLGMMTTIIPIWLSECSTPKSRGRMMAMQPSNLIVGLILANWLDYGMNQYVGSIEWRFPCAFQIVFCLIVCVFMPAVLCIEACEANIWLKQTPLHDNSSYPC